MKNAVTPDERFMKEALRLARRGLGWTSPNPMVGAIIVKDGRIIGRGYHHRFGADHAEVDVIKHAVEPVAGATMYVTLEPCCHHGKTPPCVDALVRERFARVVIGMADPDKRVSGNSIRKLKEHGIAAEVGVLEPECRALNRAYIKHRVTGLPFVTVKFAQSLDGRIATAVGDSRWISSPESRTVAHRLRARHDAILVGAGTVLADDPELTVRHVRGRDPVRVVLDSRLSIPPDARLLTDAGAPRTIIAATAAAGRDRVDAVQRHCAEVLAVPPDDKGKISLPSLLGLLGERDITSLLVEGGAAVITAFLREKLVDRLVVFIAPKIIGRGTEAVGDLDIAAVSRAVRLEIEKTYRSGVDIVVEANIAQE